MSAAPAWRPGQGDSTPRQRRIWLARAEEHVRSYLWDHLDADAKWAWITALEYAESEGHCAVIDRMYRETQKNLRT